MEEPELKCHFQTNGKRQAHGQGPRRSRLLFLLCQLSCFHCSVTPGRGVFGVGDGGAAAKLVGALNLDKT